MLLLFQELSLLPISVNNNNNNNNGKAHWTSSVCGLVKIKATFLASFLSFSFYLFGNCEDRPKRKSSLLDCFTDLGNAILYLKGKVSFYFLSFLLDLFLFFLVKYCGCGKSLSVL